MTSTLEHELTEYLRREASRVYVNDTLDHIERDVTVVAFAPSLDRPRRALPLIGAVASIILAAGRVIAAPDSTPHPPVAGSATSPTESLHDTTVAPTTESVVPPSLAATITTLALSPVPASIDNGPAPFITSVARPSQPTTVVVINASGVHGTAGVLSNVLSAGGWGLRSPESGTASAESTIYFRDDSATTADELAGQLHIVNRAALIDGDLPGLNAAALPDVTFGVDLVIVVGEDFVQRLCPPPNDIACVRNDN